MKFLLFAIAFVFYGCSGRQNSIKIEREPLSFAQIYLQNLVDSFKTEYKSQEAQLLRDSTFSKYQKKLYTFLSENFIDNIKVHVDSIVVKGWTVLTKLHCNKDIAFQYSLTFTKNMTKNEDSLFSFAKNLKMGSDITANFSFMGSQKINDPNDSTLPTFLIYAFPALKFSAKK